MEPRARQRQVDVAPTLIAAGLLLLAVAVIIGKHVEGMAVVIAALSVFAAWHRALLRWESLLGLIVLVVIFVPIGRYTLPASLPIELEIYRVVVAAVVMSWLAAALVDDRVRLRTTPLDAPIILLVAVVFGSILANPSMVEGVGTYVAKALGFLLSFVLVYYLVVSVITTWRGIVGLLKLLVVGFSLIAVLGIVEQRTQYNVFDHLGAIFPFLEYHDIGSISRGGAVRIYGSSQHPIAMGAAFALLIPVALAFAYRYTRLWWISVTLLAIGVFATASRTAILMLAVSALVLASLKPRAISRLWPLAIPAVVIVHAALPGALGTMKNAFFPAGGLIAEQSQFSKDYNPLLSGGRIRQLGPSLDQASTRPLFGQGFGTRVTGFNTPGRNAPILDNQWLGTLLEIGILGLTAWVWIFVRSVRRLHRAARSGGEDHDWILAALASSIAAFGVGMLTFDAFAFVQVAFVFWILLGLASSALLAEGAAKQRVEQESAASKDLQVG